MGKNLEAITLIDTLTYHKIIQSLLLWPCVILVSLFQAFLLITLIHLKTLII